MGINFNFGLGKGDDAQAQTAVTADGQAGGQAADPAVMTDQSITPAPETEVSVNVTTTEMPEPAAQGGGDPFADSAQSVGDQAPLPEPTFEANPVAEAPAVTPVENPFAVNPELAPDPQLEVEPASAAVPAPEMVESPVVELAASTPEMPEFSPMVEPVSTETVEMPLAETVSETSAKNPFAPVPEMVESPVVDSLAQDPSMPVEPVSDVLGENPAEIVPPLEAQPVAEAEEVEPVENPFAPASEAAVASQAPLAEINPEPVVGEVSAKPTQVAEADPLASAQAVVDQSNPLETPAIEAVPVPETVNEPLAIEPFVPETESETVATDLNINFGADLGTNETAEGTPSGTVEVEVSEPSKTVSQNDNATGDPVVSLADIKSQVQAFMNEHHNNIADYEAQIKLLKAKVVDEENLLKEKKAEFQLMLHDIEVLTDDFGHQTKKQPQAAKLKVENSESKAQTKVQAGEVEVKSKKKRSRRKTKSQSDTVEK